MSKVNVNTIEPSTGTDITLGASGDTITVPSGATFTQSGTMNASAITAGTLPIARGGTGAATLAAAGLSNTPVFRSYMSGNQSISSATATKVSLNTTTFDSGGDFDTTNNRFVVPSGGAGKYFFYTQIRGNIVPASLTFVYFYVDGVADGGYLRFTQTNQGSNQISAVLDLADAAYVEVFYYDNGTSPTIFSDADNYSYFTGYKLIGA